MPTINQLTNDLEALARDCVNPYPKIKPGEEELPCGALLPRLMERQELLAARPLLPHVSQSSNCHPLRDHSNPGV